VKRFYFPTLSKIINTSVEPYVVFSMFSFHVVTIIGGIVFLAFAFSALFIKPDAV
jgi:hypothetical protein